MRNAGIVFDTQIHELSGFPIPANTLRLDAFGQSLLIDEDARNFFAIPAVVEVYLSIYLTQIEVGCFYLHLGEVHANGVGKGVYLIGHRHENDGSVLRFQGKSFDDIYNVLPDYLAPFRRAAEADWKQTVESLTELQRDEILGELVKLEAKTPIKRWKIAEMLAQVLQGFKYAQVISIKESRNRGMLIRVANKPDIYDRLLPETQGEKSVLTITVEGNATINSKLQSSQREVKINEGDTYHIGQAGAVGRSAHSDNNNFVQSEQKRTLSEAATEIQQLLKQLEQTNPSATELEQITYVNDETTPSFKRHVVSELQASGEAAIDEFILKNKYFKVVKAAIKGWLQPNS